MAVVTTDATVLGFDRTVHVFAVLDQIGDGFVAF
jgi:hypothetical protein